MKILGIGIATLDIINVVDGYPPEDSEVRALEQQQRRGGNATNTLVVLSQLGHHCHWGGVLAEEPDSEYILEDLARHHIDIRHCRRVATGKVPTSYIILNRRNGSRTIVHYRDLPEFGFGDFDTIELAPFQWVHFEGRNVPETRRMLEKCVERHPTLPLSLEVEKIRPEIDTLFPLATVLLFSRAYARHQGFDDPERFLLSLRKRLPGRILVCAWGERGAAALDRDGTLCSSPAYPPPRLVDTTGAGDVFNAGIIDGLLRGESLETTLHAACRLAGAKCGISGFDGLKPPSRAHSSPP